MRDTSGHIEISSIQSSLQPFNEFSTLQSNTDKCYQKCGVPLFVVSLLGSFITGYFVSMSIHTKDDVICEGSL